MDEQTPLISTARTDLRTDFFKTRERPSTQSLWVRYTNTVNDPRIDAAFLDPLDSKKGYFGLTYHYIIRTNGHIEIGRDPKTISSVGKRHLQPSQIVIGIVGGLSFGVSGPSPAAKRHPSDISVQQAANETPEQEAALEWLMQALADTLNCELEVTDAREYLRSGKHLETEEPPDENGDPIFDEDE